MEMSIEPMKAATEARYLELRRRRLRSERRREQQKVQLLMWPLCFVFFWPAHLQQ